MPKEKIHPDTNLIHSLGMALENAVCVTGIRDELPGLEQFLKSQKFYFRDIPSEIFFGGIDYGNQLAEHGLMHLPFPDCTFIVGPYTNEWAESGIFTSMDSDTAEGVVSFKPQSKHYFIATAWEDNDDPPGIKARMYIMNDGHAGAPDKRTHSGGATYIIPPKTTFNLKNGMVRFPLFLTQDGFTRGWCAPDNRTLGDFKQELDRLIPKEESHTSNMLSCSFKIIMSIIYGAIGCLNSQGLIHETVSGPRKLNEIRARKGKSPLPDHRTVRIDLGKLRMPGLSTKISHGERASPRMHWRRGHNRRLPRSEKRVWIQPVLVNSPKDGNMAGLITHDYAATVNMGSTT